MKIEKKIYHVLINKINITVSCQSLKLNGTGYCEWNYDGLGWDYHVLAGPSFMIVFTIAGVFIGIAADRFHRCKKVFTKKEKKSF